MSNVVASCEFYSPINLESSFGSTRISKKMFSTMDFYKFSDGDGAIEWVVFDDLGDEIFVEQIGIFFNEQLNYFEGYDGVFDIPREAITLLQSTGMKFDPEEWENELNYPENNTLKITTK